LEKSKSHLFYSYNVISSLLEHRKTEVFHFSRLQEVFNLPLLDLNQLGSLVLHLKNTWCYLRFIFDRKLLFWQHIKFYSNKALSTVKCMKMLNNSMYKLLPQQKCLLYKTCILSIVLHGFPL